LIAVLRSTPAIVVALWAVWSTAFIAIKVGLSAASPEVFALFRVAAAVAALAIVVWVRRASGRGLTATPGLHRVGFVLGLLNVAGFLVFQNVGMSEAPVGMSSVLIYTQPLWVALAARFVLREKLTFRRVTGLVLGWSGIVAVVSGELDSVVAPPVSSVVFLLASGACWAAGTILFKSVAAGPAGADLWRVLLWQNVYGLVPVGLVVLLRPGSVTWGLPLTFGVLWAGVGASVLGFGLQFVLLRRGEAGVVSSWIFPVPILASFLGVALLGERLHLGLVFGAGAVAAGIYLVNSTSRRKVAAVEPAP
jgi:drug/metabolite transporter (DMT)-like permease